MRIILLAASIALLTGGALAAQSALTIGHAGSGANSPPKLEARKGPPAMALNHAAVPLTSVAARRSGPRK